MNVPAAKAPTIADVTNLAQGLLADVQSKMIDASTATAQRAFADANEAIGALERSIQLSQYEAIRQLETKKARDEAATTKAATDKARAEAEERRKHILALQREAQRENQLKAAREYLKRNQK